MAENSKIEWCDHTFNPWVGCTKISPGCDRCYAEGWSKRSGLVKWGNHPRHRTSEAYWQQPLKWAKAARETGSRPRVFCASLADVFDNQVPTEWRMALFNLIQATPELDWLLLTKRPENIAYMLDEAAPFVMPAPNIWLGFTAEDQPHFDRRWPIVRQIPAAVRFCSYEPAIGPLRLNDFTTLQPEWLICGGESGHGYRILNMQWEFDIRHDCEKLGVKYFFKQKSGKLPIPDGFPVVREFPRSPA